MRKLGWGDRQSRHEQGTFLYSSQNPVFQNGLYVSRNGPLHFPNSPYKQRWQFPKAPFIILQYSLPLPSLENLALKQKKAKAKNWWNRFAKAGSWVFQKIPHPQALMFNYSDHIILLTSGSIFSVLLFCVTFSICYCKKKKKLTFKYFINFIGFPGLVCIPKHHREHDFNGKLMHQLATIWGHIWKKGTCYCT